jgi:hypothetical protein
MSALARLLRARRGLLPLVLVGAAAFALTLWLFAPGYMSRDSGTQLEQARTLVLNDHHPVLMALIWRITDTIVPGPLGMLALMSAIYWASLSDLAWGLAWPVLARAAVLLGIGFFPPVLSVVPVIWKDTLMQATLLAALALAAAPPSGRRALRAAVAAVCLLVAIGARHNAAAAAWPIVALLLLRWPVLTRLRPGVRLLATSALAIGITLGSTLALQRGLAPLARAESFWQQSLTFDLAGMSLRTGKLLVPPDTGVLSPGMGLDEIRRLYRPDYNASLYYCVPFAGSECTPVFNRVRDEQQLANLRRSWRQAVLRHPGSYLAHRLQVAALLLRWQAGAGETYFLKGAPHHRLAGAYPPRPLTLAALRWIEAQLDRLVFRPWIYLAIACLLLPIALLGHLRRGHDLPAVCLLSGLAYFLSVVLAAGTPDYRYMVWTILATLLAAVTSVRPPPSEARAS